MTEARAAGGSLVASDLPINREAAERPGGGHVIFVPADASPLHVADAIEEAAGVSVLPGTPGADLAASWESVVESTWLLYRELTGVDRTEGLGAEQGRLSVAAGGAGGAR